MISDSATSRRVAHLPPLRRHLVLDHLLLEKVGLHRLLRAERLRHLRADLVEAAAHVLLELRRLLALTASAANPPPMPAPAPPAAEAPRPAPSAAPMRMRRGRGAGAAEAAAPRSERGAYARGLPLPRRLAQRRRSASDAQHRERFARGCAPFGTLSGDAYIRTTSRRAAARLLADVLRVRSGPRASRACCFVSGFGFGCCVFTVIGGVTRDPSQPHRGRTSATPPRPPSHRRLALRERAARQTATTPRRPSGRDAQVPDEEGVAAARGRAARRARAPRGRAAFRCQRPTSLASAPGARSASASAAPDAPPPPPPPLPVALRCGGDTVSAPRSSAARVRIRGWSAATERERGLRVPPLRRQRRRRRAPPSPRHRRYGPDERTPRSGWTNEQLERLTLPQ